MSDPISPIDSELQNEEKSLGVLNETVSDFITKLEPIARQDSVVESCNPPSEPAGGSQVVKRIQGNVGQIDTINQKLRSVLNRIEV